MKVRKYRMMTPGPTDVPAEVLLAGAAPQIHHRSKQFQAVYAEVLALLKGVFKTSEQVYPLLSSGSGAMECCVANLTTPGTKPIVVVGGWFGKRWNDICRAYGMETDVIDVAWGESVSPDAVRERLKANPDCPAVFVQLCETSTGALHPVRELQEVCSSTNALLVVDGISGVGAEPFETEAWKIDAVISGAQKSFMIPPGLSYITLGVRAWKRVEESRHPRFYFDLRKYRDGIAKNTHPFTPPTSLMRSQLVALKMLAAEGLENTIARHARLAAGMRKGIAALGLKLFAKNPANALTSVWMPENLDSGELVARMRDEEGVTIAGAQGPWKGKFFRMGHLGYVDENDIILALSALERILYDMKIDINPGAGIRAAQDHFLRKELTHDQGSCF